MNYFNEICSGCGKRFSEGDDIVVCPECGTPQHRECWSKEHKCVNEHLHEDGFEWKAKHTEQQEKSDRELAKRPCPFCGYENPIDAKECANCSQMFSMFGMSVFPKDDKNGEEHRQDEYSYKPPFKIDYEESPSGQGYEPFGQIGQDNSKRQFVFNSETYDSTVLDIETKDFAAYIRVSVKAYYKKFKRFENGKKLSFNFGSFIFGSAWFFLRKLYKAGIVFLSLTLCLTMLFYAPMSKALESYSDLMEQMEEISSSEERTDETSEERTDEQKLDEITEKTYEFARENAPVIYLYMGGMLAIHLAAALTADILYKKKFVKDINDVKDEAQGDNEKRYLLILHKGGVSLFAPLAAYIVMQVAISLLVRVFF